MTAQTNEFGAAVRKARLNAEMTQRELADKLGYSGSSGVVSVSNIERGVHYPSLEKLGAIIEALPIPQAALRSTLELRIMLAALDEKGIQLSKDDVDTLMARLRRT